VSPCVYLDTSALVKLVRPEAETKALFRELSRWEKRTSSAFSRVELHRTLRRADAGDDDLRRGEAALSRLFLIDIDDAILQSAADLHNKHLRTLDAIHLATALSIRRDLGALIVYDGHFREAAEAEGLPVIAPGTRR
jgi:predicted nucleic acid-binding protein